MFPLFCEPKHTKTKNDALHEVEFRVATTNSFINSRTTYVIVFNLHVGPIFEDLVYYRITTAGVATITVPRPPHKLEKALKVFPEIFH
jgi:hypothetical protein